MMSRELNTAPAFSVLVPTHNRADVLVFALRSIRAQTFQDFEVLVVGDGCTDHTNQAVASFGDPRIRWFDLPKAPNLGYANRNLALREARGDYIAFLAHDDLWLPDHLELLRGCFEDPRIELAYTRPLWVIPPGQISPSTFNLHDTDTLKLFLSGGMSVISAGCVVHRRECFQKYGYWDEALPACGDYELWRRIILRGGERNFIYLAEPSCLHFRANWRTEKTAGNPYLPIWKELHTLAGFVPQALKISIPVGLSEQEAIWLEVDKSPEVWTKQVRAAVSQVLDHRINQMDLLLLEIMRRQELLDQTRDINVVQLVDPLLELINELQFTETSLSWRWVRGFQKMKTRALPPASRREKIWQKLVRASLRGRSS